MNILEHEIEWGENYQQFILASYQQTGQFSLQGYQFANNKEAPQGPAVNLSSSRLLFISSCGAFLPESQDRFDANSPLGDYSIRKIPVKTPLVELDFAHTHYDQTAVRQDPQTLLPLSLLGEKVVEGEIGELADYWVSFMGYQPDLTRVVHETIPRILAVAAAEKAHMALLVPA